MSHCHGLDPWWGEGSSPSQEAGLGLLTPVIRENTSRSGLSFHTFPRAKHGGHRICPKNVGNESWSLSL